jgi:hypothetical protein
MVYFANQLAGNAGNRFGTRSPSTPILFGSAGVVTVPHSNSTYSLPELQHAGPNAYIAPYNPPPMPQPSIPSQNPGHGAGNKLR